MQDGQCARVACSAAADPSGPHHQPIIPSLSFPSQDHIHEIQKAQDSVARTDRNHGFDLGTINSKVGAVNDTHRGRAQRMGAQEGLNKVLRRQVGANGR